MHEENFNMTSDLVKNQNGLQEQQVYPNIGFLSQSPMMQMIGIKPIVPASEKTEQVRKGKSYDGKNYLISGKKSTPELL